jgi:RNA polymerase primary sigma factor
MSTVSITAVTKLKHTGIYKAIQKAGGQKALADHLGICQTTISGWCNLHRVPTFLNFTPERRADIEKKLFDLTGQTLDDLFPRELAEAREFLKSSKTSVREQEIEAAALLDFRARNNERLAGKAPIEDAEQGELREDIDAALKTLTYRERAIVTQRFGLGGIGSLTLDETAKVHGVTRERIRQIETRAIRKLQGPSRSALISGHA